MTKDRDPLGKRALFSGAEAKPAPRPARGPLDLVVHCSGCDATTELSAPRLVVQHVPFWAWIPGRKHSHLMRCPACNRLAWLSVSRPH